MFTKTSNGTGKRVVGVAAAGLVEDGMTIGVGTGSTAACFIDALIARVRKGLKVQAVATSVQSQRHAEQGGIPVLGIDNVSEIDLAIDGADEIDGLKRMIKGGGGALLREKIIDSLAHEMVVIVDEGKLVDKLGSFGLPIEVVPFGVKHTLRRLSDMGYKASLRMSGKKPTITDNGNYVADISFSALLDQPEDHDVKIRSIPGVVETGFFLDIAGRVLVGNSDGTVEIQS